MVLSRAPLQFDVQAQRFLKLGKSAQEFLQSGGLAQLFAQHKLRQDQIEGSLDAVPQRRIAVQEIFRQDPLAAAPPFALFAQHPLDQGSRCVFSECVHAAPLARVGKNCSIL
jgi:hypothetical protein